MQTVCDGAQRLLLYNKFNGLVKCFEMKLILDKQETTTNTSKVCKHIR